MIDRKTISAIIKNTEDLDRKRAITEACKQAWDLALQSTGKKTSPLDNLLADIYRRRDNCESNISYDDLYAFGFQTDVSPRLVVDKLNDCLGIDAEYRSNGREWCIVIEFI